MLHFWKRNFYDYKFSKKYFSKLYRRFLGVSTASKQFVTLYSFSRVLESFWLLDHFRYHHLHVSTSILPERITFDSIFEAIVSLKKRICWDALEWKQQLCLGKRDYSFKKINFQNTFNDLSQPEDQLKFTKIRTVW